MTTTTPHSTQILPDQEVPAITLVREFDAPRHLVYRAHTEADLLVQWLGPRRLTMRVDEYDVRRGGRYRYVHSGDDGQEHWFYGSFHNVVADEKIVQTFTYEGYPEGVALETLTLEDLGGGRTRLTAFSLCDSFADRDGMLASGMAEGVNDGYEKLDELLERLVAGGAQ